MLAIEQFRAAWASRMPSIMRFTTALLLPGLFSFVFFYIAVTGRWNLDAACQ